MGNMSNPSINRWGFNLFWYKLWYQDKNYALTLHQDRLFTKLIYIYLMYGILYPTNIFINNYWYFNKLYPLKNYQNNHNTKYYRIMNFRSTAMNIEASYSVRINIRNIYTTKVWLFRYQNWLVINFYCFQPPQKRLLKNKARVLVSKDSDFYLKEALPNNFVIKRLKFIILYYLLSKETGLTSYYNF